MESFLTIVLIFAALLQIMMIVKFFQIAEDVREIKGYLKGKLTDLPYSQEAKFQQAKEEEKSERPEFTWKSLIALIILLIICICLLYLYI